MIEIRNRLLEVGHLCLNAIDTSLIRGMFNPVAIKKVHISFDDVHESLAEIIEKKYQSIFENSFFSTLKNLNDAYNARFSLYLFEDEHLTLTPSVIQELQSCENWMHIGYHANLDGKADVDSYCRFQQCFGKTGLISKTCRLHGFNADSLLVCKMYESGIRELLCADDGRQSYGISHELYTGGYTLDGMSYTPTDVRLERLCFKRLCCLGFKERLVIFAHEKPFNKNYEKQKLEAILKQLPKTIEFDY